MSTALASSAKITGWTPDDLSVEEIARLFEERVMRDKSYQLLPLGMEAAEYLRYKRKRMTKSSLVTYEYVLDKLAREFPHLEIGDFEPPAGTRLLEKFLDDRWGGEPRTYNRNLSVISNFFKRAHITGKMIGNPTTAIERAKPRQVHRTTFTADQSRAIIASQDDRRDRIALRLLLNYGIRKGALQQVQYQHFDHVRKRLTIFTKGGKVRDIPLPHPEFWFDLERLILDCNAEGFHYLMPGRRGNQRAMNLVPDKPISAHGLHNWWYRCLENAGVVALGTRKGERMHKARHTAGQRVLDHTGNLKAVQKLLGHSSIQTTGDTYTDWDIEQLNVTMAQVLSEDSE